LLNDLLVMEVRGLLRTQNRETQNIEEQSRRL